MTPSSKPKTLALVVGHSHTDHGAVNPQTGITEFAWNTRLAEVIEKYLTERGKITVIRLWREGGITPLVRRVNASGADVYVELHANAFNRVATGSETLYWHASEQGKALAGAIQRATVRVLGLPDRGIKARRAGDRGSQQLGKSRPVAVLTEPFFIDNLKDLDRATAQRDALAVAMATAIERFMLKQPEAAA